MNDQPLNEQSDADIRQWFDVSTPPSAAGLEQVEDDLSAVRNRSIAVRRRRVFAGGTAAALLLVGGTALTLGRGGDDSPTLVDAAAFSDQPTSSDPIGDEPATPPTTDEPVEDQSDDDNTSTPDESDSAGDADRPSADDSPIDDIPLPDLAEWAEIPWVDEDGNVDWQRFLDEQQAIFAEWAEQLEQWFEEHPEFGKNIEIGDWLGDTELDDWTSKLDDHVSDLDEFLDFDASNRPWPDVKILDGQIELDFDGDGVVDKTVEWDLPDLDGLPDFDDFELPDISIPDFEDLDLGDIDFSDFDFGDIDFSDIDFSDFENLDLSDLENLDFGDFEFPDISIPDFDELDGIDVPDEVDDLLADLRTELDNVFGTPSDD